MTSTARTVASDRGTRKGSALAADGGQVLPPLARLGAVPLTDVESRLADVISRGYPQAALLSAREIAAAAAVSPASVSRFARKLGYAGFAGLQRALAAELRARLSTPPGRLEVTAGRNRSIAALLQDVAVQDADNIESTRQMIDLSDLERLANELRRRDARVYIAGSKKGGIVAAYFAMQLAQLRPGVRLLGLSELLPDSILDMDGTDVLVLFEPRRATTALVRLLQHARSLGVTVAAFTDEYPSAPLADCDLLFRTRVEAVSVFDSYAAMLVLCDTLLAYLVQRMPRAVQTRAERLEAVNQTLETWYGTDRAAMVNRP